MRLFVFLILLSIAAGVPHQRHAQLLRLTPALRVRGGEAGSIDSRQVAGKLLTGAFLAHGTSLMLAPKATSKAYGRDAQALSEICSAALGAYVAALGVVGYSLLVNHAGVKGSIGAGLVTINLGDNVKSILNDFPGRHGMHINGLLFTTVFMAAAAYALLTDQDYASNLTKALCTYGAANAAFGCVRPVQFATTWGLRKEDMDQGYVHVLRMYCWTLLAFCTLTLTLLADVDPLESLACASTVVMIGLFSRNFITKDAVQLEMKQAPLHAWIVGLAVLATTILLPAFQKEGSPLI